MCRTLVCDVFSFCKNHFYYFIATAIAVAIRLMLVGSLFFFLLHSLNGCRHHSSFVKCADKTDERMNEKMHTHMWWILKRIEKKIEKEENKRFLDDVLNWSELYKCIWPRYYMHNKTFTPWHERYIWWVHERQERCQEF